MKYLALVSGFLTALALMACGNSSSADSARPQAEPSVVEVTGPRSKRKILIPPGPPPKHLVVRDLREGTGPAVESVKDEIVVNYVGVGYSLGNVLYNSWDDGRPSTFLLEETHTGWERGLKGMKADGVRELITPPRLQYGAGTDTLIYVIELVRLKPASRS